MKALKNGKKISYTGNGRGHVNSLEIYLEGINSLLSRNSWILKL